LANDVVSLDFKIKKSHLLAFLGYHTHRTLAEMYPNAQSMILGGAILNEFPFTGFNAIGEYVQICIALFSFI
jgi:hypothetical protein